MDNYIFDIYEIVFVPELDMYGKIIDMRVNEDDNTEYMVIFDNGTWDSFLGFELKGDGLYVL